MLMKVITYRDIDEKYLYYYEYLTNMIDSNDHHKRHKMYPRASGHCYSHHIPANVVTPEEETLFTDEELQQALQYLHKIDADLVKGDLVIFDAVEGYRNTGVAIFDGINIIDLASELDDYGNLPQSFRVIEGGVPIRYWEFLDETNEGRGITHNRIVWFDHSKVLQQCLANIKFGLVDDKHSAIHTTFYYAGQQYNIIYEVYGDPDVVRYIDELTVRLSDLTNLLEFEYDGETIPGVPNTLYLKAEDY